MPTYTEPNVYVEEQPSSFLPIQAASTSIAGFVGVTERGPLRPTLISSLGEFRSIYGGTLDRTVFTSGGRGHHALPEAVAGFFLNLGQACWVVRVVPPEAGRAFFELADTGPAVGGVSTSLLFGAPQGSGTAINPPLIYLLEDGLDVDDSVQIGAGSEAETHTIAAIDTIATLTTGLAHVPLATGLTRTVAAGATIDELTRAANTGKFGGGSSAEFQLRQDVNPGDTEILLDAHVVADGNLIGTGPDGDILEIGGNVRGAQFVRAIAAENTVGTEYRVTLAEPAVRAFAATGADDVTALSLSTLAGSPGTLARDAARGTTLLAVNDLGAAPNLRNDDTLILFEEGGHPIAVARIADIGFLPFDWPITEVYGTGTRIRKVTTQPFARQAAGGGTTTTFGVSDLGQLFAGMPVLVGIEGPVTITALDQGATEITVNPALSAAPAAGINVVPDYRLTADAPAGSQLLAVNCRLGLDPTGGRRQIVRIGPAGAETFAEITEVPGPRGVTPDAGVVLLSTPLPATYLAGAPVRVMDAPVLDTSAGVAQVIVDAPAGTDRIAATAGDEFDAGDILEVTFGGGLRYHRLAADYDDAILPAQVTLVAPLARAHPASAPVDERTPLLLVQARDQGGAGERISGSAERENPGLVAAAEVTAQPAPDQLRLDLLTGVYRGTVFEIFDPATGVVQGPPIWVAEVESGSGNLVTLGANLDPANLPVVGMSVRSVEYRITIRDRVRVAPGQPAPANPFAAIETYDNISLNSLHPRYAPDVIGEVGGEIDPITGLTIGRSRLVRVQDLAPNPAATLGVRALATLTDTLPSGVIRAARHALLRGNDRVGLITDATYRGVVSNNPAERTGIEALRDARDCSMICCPGQTTIAVQSRLIQQCEELQDRFALLDLPETATTIQAAQAHRQNFDTSYAAIFYPWLRMLDLTPGANGQINVPPSGHMAGIYARSDNARGVHKAPANEIVMAITGLTETVGGTEHGLLNVRQINVNRVYTDRGTRLMGARTLSSDASDLYVHARRFLIFLYVSLQRGLQPLIFEPNNRRLWARVTRSITNFLLTQYRAGALFGATAEQAFFVRCDETTMTEDDIAQGRLAALVGVNITGTAEFVIIRLHKDLVDMSS